MISTYSMSWLKEFCLMYHEYERQANDICTMDKTGCICDPRWSDSTGNAVCRTEPARFKMQLIEDCCTEADDLKANDILLCVTEDIPPEYLGVSDELYGRFFDILSYKLHLL